MTINDYRIAIATLDAAFDAERATMPFDGNPFAELSTRQIEMINDREAADILLIGMIEMSEAGKAAVGQLVRELTNA